jgi:hypothetical protein
VLARQEQQSSGEHRSRKQVRRKSARSRLFKANEKVLSQTEHHRCGCYRSQPGSGPKELKQQYPVMLALPSATKMIRRISKVALNISAAID